MSGRRPRITKSMMLRICAVGLFICLGTFAVMHSMKSNNKSAEETGEASADITGDLEGTELAPSDNPIPDELKTENSIATVSNVEADQSWPGSNPSSQSNTAAGNALAAPSNPSMTASNVGGIRQALGDSSRSSTPDSEIPSAPRTSGSFVPAQTISSTKTSSIGDSGGSQSNDNELPPIRPGSSFLPPASSGAPSGQPPTGQPPMHSLTTQTPTAAASISSVQSTDALKGSTPPGLNLPPLVVNAKSASQFGVPSQDADSPAQENDNNFAAVLSQQDAPQNQPPSSPSGFGTTSGFPSGTLNRQATPPSSSRSTDNLIPDSNQFGGKPNLPPLRPQSATTDNNAPRSTANLFSQSNGHSPTPATGFQQTSQPNTPPPAAPAVAPTRNPMTNVNAASAAAISDSLAKSVPGQRQFEGVQLPALAIQKIAPSEIQVNRPASFETIVKNTGKVPAHDVQIHDFVPQGTELIQAVPSPTSNAGGKLLWNLGTLSPGQQTSIKMELMPKQPGKIGSVAQVTFAAQASSQTTCTRPELAIRHEAPETVLIGSDVILDIFVENKGNGAAENVVLQEDVPDGLQFANGHKELEYEIGTLRPGETRNIRLKLKATKVGQVRNVLVAHGAGQLQANDQIDLKIIAPQLMLSGDGPNRKYLNRQATHEFSIANQGTAAATNLQLVAKLPRGLRFVEANNQGQYDNRSHAVVWRLAKLDTLKTGKVSLTTMPIATGQQEIQVEATADLDQRQSVSQSMLVQQLAEIFFDIDDSADPIETGSSTSYKVRVINQGEKTATGVRVQVEFPQAIQPVSVEGNPRNQIRGQIVSLEPIAALQPGQEISFIVKAKGLSEGDHRIVVSVRSDDREVPVSKEESTHVYADR